MSIEYVYIRTTETPTAIHFGTTKDYKKRYKTSADEIQDTNKYLYVFECNENTGHQIETDFKNKFREYLHDREIYFWNDVLKEKYLHFIRTHKDIIREIELEEENQKVTKKIVKVKKAPFRTKINGEWTRNSILRKTQNTAKQIRANNDLTKYTEHDEYYTRYEDVEKIVGQFEKEFKNKVVFCNCDDVLDNDDNKCSAFALYFKKNFKRLKLKKLICTHFIGITNLFNQNPVGYIYYYNGDVIEIKNEKNYDGSFYHPESIRILNEETDICCTNHPWSLTDKFYELLFASKKKFLVISNFNIILSPNYITRIKDKTLKLFEYNRQYLNKQKLIVEASGGWFTNFDGNIPYNFDRLKIIPLSEIPENKVKIDDKAVLVFHDGFIPNDYDKPFAISIAPIINGILEKGFELIEAKDVFESITSKEYYPYIKGKRKYAHLLIQKTKSVK